MLLIFTKTSFITIDGWIKISNWTHTCVIGTQLSLLSLVTSQTICCFGLACQAIQTTTTGANIRIIFIIARLT